MKKPMLVLMLAMLMGCALLSKAPSICDDLEGPSLMCEIAAKHNVRLEDIGNALVVINEIAIIEEAYSKEDAIEVLKEIRLLLDKGALSYAMFRLAVYEKAEKYAGLIEVAESYFWTFQNQRSFIYKEDRRILRDWINRQIERLQAHN
jgi:hypothetical protein